MVAQPAGVDARRHEAVAQREHLDQRRELGRVAEVVAVLAAAHRGAGVRLAGHEADVLAGELVAHEREGQAGEIAAAADAADDHVGKSSTSSNLLLGLQADDRLVQHDVVQHAAERVLRVVAADGRFDRLADGDAQAAGAVGIGGQDLPAGVGFVRGAGR